MINPSCQRKCAKCGGPLKVHAFDDVRISVGHSESMTYPAAFCPKCRIVYFPTKKYADIYTKSP